MAKHPVPKQKISRARGSRRYKSFQNRARKRLENAVQLSKCSKCGAVIRQHHVCGECGFYRGKDVMGMVKKAEKKIEKKVEKISV